jgi:hypothetical protein
MRRVPLAIWLEALLLMVVAWLDQGPLVCPRRSWLARAWRGGLALLLHLGVRGGALLLILATVCYLVPRNRAAGLARAATGLVLALALAGLLLVGLQRLA